MKKAIILIFIFFLIGCAAKTPQTRQEEPSASWQKMLEESSKANKSFRIQLSMRAGEEGNTRRITAMLWGNPGMGYRLDIMAGVGATIAKISDTPDQFILYSPRSEKAYLQEGSTRPMLKVGVPVPFTLSQTADLLCGRFSEVFGSTYNTVTPGKAGVTVYTISGPLAGELSLNSLGAPVEWKQLKDGWSLKLTYDDNSPYLPKNIRIENVNGKFALLMVKQRDEVISPYDAEQLKLNLPQHIQPLPFSQYKADNSF